jgi:HEAT repeat protein
VEKDLGAVPYLGKALNDHGDEDVRADAALKLGNLKDPMAIEPLAKGLHDVDPEVRKSVVEALGRIGGERAIPLLTEALNDKEEEVRNAAAEALEGLAKAPAGEGGD